MTLAQLISTMELVASKQPSINMIVQNDVYRINAAPDLKYGIFAWTQGQHTGDINGMVSYRFTLFYVDRLKEDKSNQIEIQSVGCETIANILRLLDDYDIEVSDYTIQTFNQRFTDECAGIFCQVSLSVLPSHICGEALADYDESFNDDFLMF